MPHCDVEMPFTIIAVVVLEQWSFDDILFVRRVDSYLYPKNIQ